MTHYDDRRKRSIDTPLGPVQITEKKWNEGEEDEHWAYVQNFNPQYPKQHKEQPPNGEVVGFFLKQYSIARQLAADGYELYEQLDDDCLLWVNYEDS